MNSPESKKPTVKSSVPVWGFIARYWIMLFFFAIFVCAIWVKPIFSNLGPLVYLPAFSFGAMLLTVLLRHNFWRNTMDEDARVGRFTTEWRAISPELRCILSVAAFCSIFLGVCHIAAALIK